MFCTGASHFVLHRRTRFGVHMCISYFILRRRICFLLFCVGVPHFILCKRIQIFSAQVHLILFCVSALILVAVACCFRACLASTILSVAGSPVVCFLLPLPGRHIAAAVLRFREIGAKQKLKRPERHHKSEGKMENKVTLRSPTKIARKLQQKLAQSCKPTTQRKYPMRCSHRNINSLISSCFKESKNFQKKKLG